MVWWFRAASIGSFMLTCLLAFAIHEAGFEGRLGFVEDSSQEATN